MRVFSLNRIIKNKYVKMRNTRNNNNNNTLIIFDWDDTLFPTTEFFEEKWGFSDVGDIFTGPNRVHMPTELARIILRCEQHAMKLVEKAASMGTVKIVTQAELYWAHNSCSAFMPALNRLFKQLGIDVISSKEYGYSLGIRDWEDHKKITFRHLALNYRAFNTDNDNYINIDIDIERVISIGDGPSERMATRRLGKLVPCTAIIQLSDLPTGQRLEEQLRYLAKNVTWLCAITEEKRMHIKMDQLLEKTTEPANIWTCAWNLFNKRI